MESDELNVNEVPILDNGIRGKAKENVGGDKKGKEKTNSVSDDVFNGPIASTTLKMSIPIFISQIVVFSYVFIDTFFISMIDKQSTALISATGLVYPLFLIFFNLSQSMLVGASSLTARGIGQKNSEILNKIGDSGFLLSGIISVVTLVLSILFGKQAINFLAGSKLTAETIQYANDYFYYLLPGMAFIIVSYTFCGILQGEGLMQFVGLSVVLSSVVNVILDPIFIFTFKMGVKGAGLASSVAAGVTLLFLILLFAGKKTTIPVSWNILNANKKLTFEMLRIGIPASLGMFLINISTMILNSVVGSISQGAMNAWVLVSRTDQLYLIPAFAIGLTTIPMIGQNYGRGNLKRSYRIFNINLGLCLGICAFLGTIYAVFAPQIFGLFSSVPEVIDAAAKQVRLLTVTTIGVAGLNVIGSAFQATGRPIPNLVNDVVRMAIISTPIFLPLVSIDVKDMTPVFVSLGIGNALAFIIAYAWGVNHFNKLQTTGKSLTL